MTPRARGGGRRAPRGPPPPPPRPRPRPPPPRDEFADRMLNSPVAEGAVLGACVGAALAGQRPIGEIQFNDFVATGFNQLVNNAAKIRYRWGGSGPVVGRLPGGG